MSSESAYQEKINSEVSQIRDLADKAKQFGEDPKQTVEMEQGQTVADRCEKLLDGELEYSLEGLSDSIATLSESGLDRDEIAFEIAEEIAAGEVGEMDSDEQRVDAAIRVSVALLTEGVVAAPIDGIGEVSINQNDDGSSYIRVPYYGPIRSAGGTGQALSVLVADYIRQQLSLSAFAPRSDEVERYVEELRLYDDEVGLQYMPGEDESRHIVENCPIMIDGVQTTDGEVEGYRNLERIDGNRGRGGMCLVVGEGIAQKAPKLKKYTASLDIVGWQWLDELKLVTDGNGGKEQQSEEEDTETSGLESKSESGVDGWRGEAVSDLSSAFSGKIDAIKPKKKFMADVIAGRPVFAGASRRGGYRLRYGRSRNIGLASCGFHPASMVIADDFMAPGTQLKTEKPGKAAGTAPVDSIEGPTVRLATGEVTQITDVDEARRVQNGVDEILDLGEVLVPYGEFLENNHPILPSPYVPEWWIQEYAEAKDEPVDSVSIDTESLSYTDAWKLAQRHEIPLHPKYTPLWHDISVEDYETLSHAFERADSEIGGEPEVQLSEEEVTILETLLVPHQKDQRDSTESTNRITVTLSQDWYNVLVDATSTEVAGHYEDVIACVSASTGCKVRERSPVRVGTRMGRPEKSSRREMSPPVHGLFPVGDAGGNTRRIGKAAEHDSSGGSTQNVTGTSRGKGDSEDHSEIGTIETNLTVRTCGYCEKETWRVNCPECGERTVELLTCQECRAYGHEEGECDCGGMYTRGDRTQLNIKSRYREALETLSIRPSHFDTLKGVKGLTSASKIPEPLEKGMLRAKYDIDVFRDGTARYDMVDLPLTSFRPSEVGVSVETLQQLGYTEDINGDPLTSEDQVLYLKEQDIILSEDCGDYLTNVAQFIDDLLESYYGVDTYYDVTTKQDLLGELVVGLAPHTSAGVAARIVGYTDASANLAHPYYHAAKRRNTDGDEDSVMLLLDGFLNFSREYLPDVRGKRTMDAPLVISTTLDPEEIDDEAHNVESVRRYPKEFYEQTYQVPSPDELNIPIAEDQLTSTTKLEHTHTTSDIASGPSNSAYKSLGSMADKTQEQLELAKKTRAINDRRVAEEVIGQHFITDIIGNLTSFAKQDVRCPQCNNKYSRPPLSNTCDNCGGDIILTVHEGSVKKYVDISMDISERFQLSRYMQQRLTLLDNRIKSVFEDDKQQQSDISDFM